MRIAVITRCLVDGGTERVIARLSVIWTNLGHKVVFFTSRGIMRGEFEHSCVARECAPHDEWTIESFTNACERHKADVFVFNDNWNHPLFDSLLRICEEQKSAIVVLLHHSFNNWAFAQCNKGDFYKDICLKRITTLVCVDPMQALWWHMRMNRVAYIPNPCSVVGTHANKTQSQKNKHPTFVWIGRPMDWGKRVELAVESFARILASCRDATLLVVGFLDEPCRKRLKRLVSENVWNRISFTGYLTDVSSVLSMADVSLVTTQWEVTIPQVIQESLALGVPVVAFDIPVFRQLDSDQGIVLVSTVDEMAQMSVRLVDDLDFRRRVVSHSKATISQWNQICEESWRELFENIQTNTINSYLSSCRVRFNTERTYRLLVEEIYRGESYFVKNCMLELMAFRKLKRVVNRLIRFVGFRWK